MRPMQRPRCPVSPAPAAEPQKLTGNTAPAPRRCWQRCRHFGRGMRGLPRAAGRRWGGRAPRPCPSSVPVARTHLRSAVVCHLAVPSQVSPVLRPGCRGAKRPLSPSGVARAPPGIAAALALPAPAAMAVPSLALPAHVPCVASRSRCAGLGALCSSSPWLCWGRTMSSLGATRGLSSWSRPEASPRDSPAWGWERRSKPEGEFRVGDAAVVSL